MSIFEYDEEATRKAIRDNAYERGVEDGRKDGENKGKIEGGTKEIVEMGREFGLTDDNILERLQDRLNITLEEAKKYFTMFGRAVKEL